MPLREISVIQGLKGGESFLLSLLNRDSRFAKNNENATTLLTYDIADSENCRGSKA